MDYLISRGVHDRRTANTLRAKLKELSFDVRPVQVDDAETLRLTRLKTAQNPDGTEILFFDVFRPDGTRDRYSFTTDEYHFAKESWLAAYDSGHRVRIIEQ